MIGIPLWMVVQFVDFSKQTIIKQIIYAVSLCLFTLFVWLAVAYIILYILVPIAVFDTLWTSIFVRIVVGLLVYIGLWQWYKRMLFQENNEDSIIEKKIEQPNEVESKVILDTIVTKEGSNIRVISLIEIVYLQAEGDYVLIRTHDGGYVKEQTMKSFEQQLPAHQFVRVHRSYIVAVAALKGIELYEKQQYVLLLKNGEKIKMSINGYKLLKQQLAL
ncbi:MAG: LytTR family transcriptional regulator [Paludibacteraceae bacterium]|nr:LytTR family transcriptional regulator [Paludibacteraceae bacterium]